MLAFEPITGVLHLDSLEILSDRLILKPISTEYTRYIFEEFNEEVTRYMGPSPAKSIEDTVHFVEQAIQKRIANNDLTMVILDRHSEEFLGCVGLHGRSTPKTPEIGIWIKLKAHGLGIGKEAVTLVYTWARNNLQIDYFTYPVDRANLSSRKIPESLGGSVFNEEPLPRMNGGTLDGVIYKILP